MQLLGGLAERAKQCTFSKSYHVQLLNFHESFGYMTVFLSASCDSVRYPHAGAKLSEIVVGVDHPDLPTKKTTLAFYQ